MVKNKSIEKSFIIPIVVIIISILVQLFVVPILPDKYFFDSIDILSIVNGTPNRHFDGSYLFAGNFFSFINILHLTTFRQWSFLLTVLGLLLLTFSIKEKSKIKIRNLVLLIATTFFLNVYIFRIGKDFIQWIFWIIISFSILDKNNKRRIIITALMFVLEYLFFKQYYIAIYFGYVLIKQLLGKATKKNRIKYNKIAVTFLVVIFAMLVLVQFLSPSMYYRITHVRQMTNYNRIDSANAVTIITDLFDSKNVVIYIVNFIINFLRILFPLELVIKGFFYVPFVVFQIYLMHSIFNSVRNNSIKADIATRNLFSMFVAFLLVSSIFEPDFGSLIRHEISCSPIFVTLLFMTSNKGVIRNDKN